MTREPRVHIIPVSFEACRLVVVDTQPMPNDHCTFIGWNPSWVKVGDVWVRAYRPNVLNEVEARRVAEQMVNILDNVIQNAQYGIYEIKYVGLGNLSK